MSYSMYGYNSDWLEWESPAIPPEVPKEKSCNHEWKAVELIYSTVYDCKKCGMKREDYDKE